MGLARKRKFFRETALPAGGDGNAQLEFVGELILAIVAVNLTAFAGWFAMFVQAFDR